MVTGNDLAYMPTEALDDALGLRRARLREPVLDAEVGYLDDEAPAETVDCANGQLVLN